MAFKKGQSGNPGGRPKLLGEVQEAARKYTTKAIKTLAAIIEDSEQPTAARVKACEVMLDRGWGKAGQSLEMSGKDGGPIVVAAQLDELV